MITIEIISFNYYCTEFLSELPSSNFDGFISTPIILVAPAALQPIAAARPTAPKPHTAQELFGSTLAVLRAAP